MMMRVAEFHLRMALLYVSAMNTSPAGPTATPAGQESVAFVPGPPSPLYPLPRVAFPAIVVMMPVTESFLMTLL